MGVAWGKMVFLKKNQNPPRPSEHPPVRGGDKMSKLYCPAIPIILSGMPDGVLLLPMFLLFLCPSPRHHTADPMLCPSSRHYTAVDLMLLPSGNPGKCHREVS